MEPGRQRKMRNRTRSNTNTRHDQTAICCLLTTTATCSIRWPIGSVARVIELDASAGYADALERLRKKSFDLVLADVRLRDGDGFDLLEQCRRNWPAAQVILMTGYGSPDGAIEAIRAGAFDYITKPLIDNELLMTIERAISQRSVRQENDNLRAQLDRKYGMDNIVGRDPRMLKVFEMIGSVADTRATVLVTGESGTGKSMIARAIHRRSGRAKGPFVEVACGALPETLLESELFGHVAGAFTGAAGEKMGKFLQADGGTIFLDEIGTASPAMQVKLLRVLQELKFEQVGGTKTFEVDVRVVLATNEDLSRAVAEGRFRQDLYYRVNVINIELPPLRSRVSDISTLAHSFLEQVREDSRREVTGFADDAMVDAGTLPLAGQRSRTAKRRRAGGAARQRPDHHGGRPADGSPRLERGRVHISRRPEDR